MIFNVWEGFFVVFLTAGAVFGIAKGFLRALTLLSAHLFSASLALVFSPTLTGFVTERSDIALTSHFPAFILLYLVPMLLTTQLLRAMYNRYRRKNGTILILASRFTGLLAGLMLGAFFSLLLSWILLLQPWLNSEMVFSWGGTVFSHSARILGYFMRFYV